MAEKDMTEKTLEAYNDVFADILNVALFNGRAVVKPDELSESTPRSIYKADGKLHEQERDVAKYWKNGTVRIALYGLENQTGVDADMPLRLFSYDGAAYRTQLLNGEKKKDKKGENPYPDFAPQDLRYPVITLVLYFGHKKHWDKPKTLLECLQIPDELKPFVNDYRMNLCEVAYLNDEQVNQFQSDFRIVADYFVQMRKNQNYIASLQTIEHVHEFLQLMAAITNDNRFEEAFETDGERRPTNMCEVLDRIEKKGIQQGIQQGIEQTTLSLIKNLVKNAKYTVEDALAVLEIPKKDWGKYKSMLM